MYENDYNERFISALEFLKDNKYKLTIEQYKDIEDIIKDRNGDISEDEILELINKFSR